MDLKNLTISELSDEVFTIIKAAPGGLGPRLGKVTVSGRTAIVTPHYLGITSRGAVPHLSQDIFARSSGITGVYAALEDYIERNRPPLYKFTPPDGDSRLRRFTALPDETLLVVGARRAPPVTAPAANSNTDSTISICTAVGFKSLSTADYRNAVEDVGADILIALGDIQHGRKLGAKRVGRAVDRNIDWLQDHIAARKQRGTDHNGAKLFATLLPVSCTHQRYFVEYLADEAAPHVSGLVLHEPSTVTDLPEKLHHLLRLGFTTPETPHEVLRQISLGFDMFGIPFITYATDAGIALDFTFPAPGLHSQTNGTTPPQPLGIDMWLTSHATDISPLRAGCTCYACTDHHRAFVQHLLAAKEMLGWVLIQIHNHHVIDLFFAAIRESIANDTFGQDRDAFARAYESRLPEKTGLGPRVRGYQFKSEGPGEKKKNPTTFNVFDRTEQKNGVSPLTQETTNGE